MEYILGIVTTIVGVLALLLCSETLKRADTETALVLSKQAETHQKELNEGLVERHVTKDNYIVELEEELVNRISGDELADALNSVLEEPEDDDDGNTMLN